MFFSLTAKVAINTITDTEKGNQALLLLMLFPKEIQETKKQAPKTLKKKKKKMNHTSGWVVAFMERAHGHGYSIS